MHENFTSQQALLLIECQNEWLNPKGKLHHLMQHKEQFESSLRNIELALRHARAQGLSIIHSGLRFQAGYPELTGGKAGLREAIPRVGTFPEDSWNSQFYPSLQPLQGEFVVQGRTGASAFSGSNLDVYLRHKDITEIFIAGYALHVCVESTLREAHDKGYLPILIEDASAAFTAAQQSHVLDQVVHHFGYSISTEDFKEIKSHRPLYNEETLYPSQAHYTI
ncbi:nicotinamidase-related amidase [Pontibacter ummariensis]|uniref:Nicotinamidase-related amidase n=1 Tax=Pontibacter ummariensis TaxID=1610492 RepID=A0A239LII5_9BACT|nr:cysteine hydrolase [Pontibacter ummariensis]PRY03137.1 nicotinamidase-related amidase [Pontibacter ummariensis]SNT30406.1 Nicotinamidase-related amidase [Pontibacter ummariensis]